MPVRYKRVLSEPFERALSEHEPLHALIADYRTWIPGDPDALDLHLRENDELMYYHGTTRLLTVTWHKSGKVKLSAHTRYEQIAPTGLFKTSTGETVRHARADFAQVIQQLSAYIAQAVAAANDRFYRNGKEGFWQNQICLARGPGGKAHHDWLVIDREVVLGHDDKSQLAAFWEAITSGYAAVQSTLQAQDPLRWGQPRQQKAFGNELDMLALGKGGELVCIELKERSNTNGICWGPLQAGVYREAWEAALPTVMADVVALVKQKVRLGLLPEAALARLPQTKTSPVMGVLLVARAKPTSASAVNNLEHVLGMCPGPAVQVGCWP